MLLRRLIKTGICLGVLTLSAGGQSVQPLSTQAYEEGLRRLEDNLPVLAIARFEAALAGSPKDAKGIRTIQIRLGEALVRAGRPEEALKTLEEHPEDHEALFWKSYALLTLGKLREAETSFALLAETEDATRRDHANLARARILASLRDDRELSGVFELLGKSKSKSVVAESQLLHASVLLEKRLPDDCSQLLAEIEPVSPKQEAFLAFLRGRHALAEGRYVEAEALLQPLVTVADAPAQLSRDVHSSASFAYAETLHLLGKDGPAVEFLLEFVKNNQESLFLQASFDRLGLWSRGDEVLRGIFLQRLQDWSDESSISSAPESTDLSPPSSAPLSSSPLLPYALLHRALLLAEENDKDAVSRAKFLLARLRMEAPQSPLVSRSLLETSRMHLAENKRASALAALGALELVTNSPTLRAYASELAARIQFDDQSFADAAESFERMRAHLEAAPESAEILNQGICLMLADNDTLFGQLLEKTTSEEVLIALRLERTLIQASHLQKAARGELDQFLQTHGEHPRAAEARVAFAELAVFHEPRDFSMARAQLESVDPIRLPDPLALRHLLTQLRMAELTGSKELWQTAIEGANSYLTSRPEADLKPAIRLKLAEAFYLNNDFSKAQLVFQQVSNNEEAKNLHEVALFYAARSAIKVTTPEARQEAITLFKRVLELKGTLADDSRIQLARAYLDADQTAEAIEMLAPLISTKQPALNALLLQAEALRLQNQDDKALDIYEACLDRKNLPYSMSNRIHYLQGLTLEKLGRTDDALKTIYLVVNRENLSTGEPITEWEFYYKCGSKALLLLEDAENWPGALAMARKIAAGGGPKSDDFTARAKRIQLEHMIWED